MTRWYVFTPEHESIVPLLDDGSGPIEYGSEVVEVEAPTMKEALILGLRELRKSPSGWINRYRDKAANPFTGLKAVPMENAKEEG